MVKPKKHLGQHFLKDQQIAERIAGALTGHGGYTSLLEVGPGTGVLTQFLLKDQRFNTTLAEIDQESVAYLKANFPLNPEQIYEGDFLQMHLEKEIVTPVGIIGNFPYNISSQIFFNVWYNKALIPEVVGMVQKEVAERICAPPNKKANGILSILLQAFYDTEYLFTVPPEVFLPPPKVQSGVIRLRRNQRQSLPIPEKFFLRVVKQAFSTRRKTLRNALKPMGLPKEFLQQELFDLRAEQLSVDDFIAMAEKIHAVLH